ncbi:hypothetical protein M2284_001094 [Rhodococcus sp. LBL1]|nr:hypothetical protein [Rhodococcus sp. LBL1]MDH6682811.1 hypothetical protein [Rhodococcus sp. LBL2]
MSKNYDVTVTRDGRWWMVGVPAIDGLTQARRLSEVEEMARELIALETGASLGDVAVNVHVQLDESGEDLARRAAEIKAVRMEAEAAEARALADSQRLAQELAAANIPVRDIGALLGLSYQRVSQLVNS